jgi:pectate lyase
MAGTDTAGASGTATGGGAGSGGAGQGGDGTAGQAGGGASGMGGSAGKGGAGGSAGKGGAGAGGGGNACPLDLVGFATREGGTTGGGNAAPTTVTTQAALRTCATATGPRVCRVQGTVTFNPFEEIRVTSDKTIIGEGNSAAIVMGGFFLDEGVHNVIVRNLTIRDSYIEGQNDEGGDEGGDRDGVQMDTAHHVWIDHCRFSRLGDGLIDSRMDTTFETVSWNILENHDKTFGIGWTDNVTAEITIHHNWLRNTNQRNPSTDNVLRAHLFNNVMEELDSYGNYARGGTNMVLQNSVFINVNNPHYYDTGSLVATGNIYRGVTGQQESSGTSFSFFDPGAFYGYTLDPASAVEALVERCAGPRAELGN